MIKYYLILSVFLMSAVHTTNAQNFDNSSVTVLNSERIAYENYVKSFVTEIDGSMVKLNDGTVYKLRFNRASSLHLGDEVVRIREMAIWEGFSYSLQTDMGVSESGTLQLQNPQPSLNQIAALNHLENGIEITLKDASKWLISSPHHADPRGDWWIKPDWKIGDFVLISIDNTDYVMDNLSDFSTASFLPQS